MTRGTHLLNLAILSCLAVACGSPVETIITPPPAPPALTGAAPFVVSNSVAGGSAGGSVVQGSSASVPVAFVSLVPGTLPGVAGVRIRVHRTGLVVFAAPVDGGLDPVAIPAIVGDTLTLIATGVAGPELVLVFVVPPRKPPVIVRTEPKKNKRDVVVNVRIQVVFSEPIDPASLTPQNVQLLSGGNPVAGQLGFGNPEHTIAEFTPAQALAGATDHQLVLGTGIRDLEGSPLEAAASISFTTSTQAAALGELSITTSTTGMEQGSTGYGISIDDGAVQSIGLNGTITVGDLFPGSHTVRLSGLGAKCWLAGSNPRVATVPVGGSVTVPITITCPSTGVSQLAFVRDREIYLINSDGTGLVQLSNLAPTRPGSMVWARDPAWSPDGQGLAYGIEDDSQMMPMAINVMHADGPPEVQLTYRRGIGGSASGFPAWSPDGRTIVFSTYRSLETLPSWGLFAAAASGAPDSVVLLNHPGVAYLMPAWSPDGSKIAFTRSWVGPFDDLYLMNADGLDVRPLLEAARAGPVRSYRHAAWSPDGQMIALVATTPDETSRVIAVINADGSGFRVIAQGGGDSRPAWSPDGRMIAFATADCRGDPCLSAVRFVRVDGSGEGLLVSNGHSPAWRP